MIILVFYWLPVVVFTFLILHMCKDRKVNWCKFKMKDSFTVYFPDLWQNCYAKYVADVRWQKEGPYFGFIAT